MSQRWRKRHALCVGLTLGVLLASPEARAQSKKTTTNEARAIKHMVKGTAYLATLRVEPALNEYHQAYMLFPALKKLPALIAKCHGGINKAIFFYKMHILKNRGKYVRSFKNLLAVLIKVRPTPPVRQKKNKNKIVVKVDDVTYQNLKRSAAIQTALYDYLTNQLVSTGVWKVRPSDKVYAQVRKEKFQGHTDQMAEGTGPGIGFELPATKLIKTTISKFGSRCLVSLTVYDLKGATGENNGTGKGGCKDDDLITSIDKAVAVVSSKY